MNKIIITIIIIAVAVAGGYFLFSGTPQSAPYIAQPLNDKTIPQSSSSKPTTSKSTSQSSVEEVSIVEKKVITYTNAGYSPSSLQIKLGETVVFKNESSQSMWPASAMHPTHKDYPTTGGCLGSTFDACKGVQPGDRWSFKFDIAGDWKYHDHLSPKNFGTIVVQ